MPATAVAEDGVEHYVFIADGDHFHQQAVEVEFRDPKCVVLANDGSIHPGRHYLLSPLHSSFNSH